MYAGRILSGFSVGILSMVVPVFNAEVSPKEIRGKLVSLYQLAITAGIMVSIGIPVLSCNLTIHMLRSPHHCGLY